MGYKTETFSSFSIICAAFNHCTTDIKNWISKQPEVKEESITDRFLYDLSEKISILKYKQFNRTVEGRKTGADWEWWFVFSNKEAFGARIQAKKIKTNGDNYPSIAYISNEQLQIERLLDDSSNDGLASFYSFYSSKSSSTFNMCGGPNSGQGVFLAEANKLREEIILQPRKKLTADDILKLTNPISCLFCCPITNHYKGDFQTGLKEYLKKYFPDFSKNKREDSNQNALGFLPPPSYVLQFISGKVEDWWELEYQRMLEKTSALLVIDLRQ